MLIHLIAAARPNFMKIAPLYHELEREDWAEPVIVHTGQHYDLNMSGAFFEDLRLPAPHLHLGIGSGTHAEQTGKVMIAYEKALMDQRPDLVIVVGDVNSTMAATLAASKISYSLRNEKQAIHSRKGHGPLVAHLEAGLRSFDRSMPEEINRLVTDGLADILWTPSSDADENLIREGILQDKIVRVGNIMMDSLEMLRERIQKEAVYKEYNLKSGEYGLVTLHRPANVDSPKTLKSICQKLRSIAERLPLVFPIHPRTRKSLGKNRLMSFLHDCTGLQLLKPLNYIRFMNLVFNCCLAITDSGGIQEETTYLGIPCLTMRPNTERPITIQQGTNQLCTVESIESRVDEILLGRFNRGSGIELWDGQTAKRVVRSISDIFNCP